MLDTVLEPPSPPNVTLLQVNSSSAVFQLTPVANATSYFISSNNYNSINYCTISMIIVK